MAILATSATSRCFAQPLDAAFNPGANAEVFGLTAQADGKILVGGNFTVIGGIARSHLARLNPDGTVDSAFNPGANAAVQKLVVQPDGKILVSGSFTTIAGAARARLARLNADGSLDPTFTAGADATTFGLAVQVDGKILVGGLFTSINGTPRSLLARLNPDGSLDATFAPSIAGTASGPQQNVEAIVLQPDGKILIGGNFGQVNGTARSALARLNVDGTFDSTLAIGSGANNSIETVVLQPDGKILVGGLFTSFAGQPRKKIARLSATGQLDSVGLVGPELAVRAIVPQPDGAFVVGGSFNSVGSLARNHLARFNADGSFDADFNPDVTGEVGRSTPGIYALVAPGPGQLVIGGAFAAVSGQSRSGLARLGSPLPAIALQPVGVVAQAGATITLSVAATGAPLRYQWKRNGVDLPGATHSTLALASFRALSPESYTVTVTNAYGSVSTTPASVAVGTPQPPAYTFSTLAGHAGESGAADGSGDAARFIFPSGLALDPAGLLYVSDNTGLRRIAPNGGVTTLPQTPGNGVAVDGAGNVYYHSSGQIRKRSPAGTTTVVAGSLVTGYRDGAAATALFSSDMRGTAIDRDGHLLVVDSGNAAIRRLDPSGTVSTVARFDRNGPFLSPQGLAIDPGGRLYFTDYFAGGIGQISPSGIPSFFVTNLTATVENLPPERAQERLTGITADSTGNLFVADAYNNVIRRVSVQGAISTVGGLRGVRGSTDGSGEAALFQSPAAIVVDPAGTLYVADTGNHTIRKGIRQSVALSIAAHPLATHTVAGTPVSLSATAYGDELRYQWKKDGGPIAGATQASLRIASPIAADMGYYTVVVSQNGTAIESTPAILTVSTPGETGRLVNVATRGFVPAGDSLTPGFVLRGNGTKRLVVRGVGPTLLRFGLGGFLVDPRFDLAPLGGATLVANDDWATGGATLAAASVAVGAFPLDPDSSDSAAVATVPTSTGGAYTVRITGPDEIASGLALAEVYDADPLSSPVQLVNVSTRGFVGTGANILVPGFVIGGSGPLQLLIRAVGPGLAPFGVTGLLADPQIVVTPLGQDTPVAANDNWGGLEPLRAAFAATGAFALPQDSKDAAVLVHLPPGAYTVTVSGVGNTTGTALVEIYDVP